MSAKLTIVSGLSPKETFHLKQKRTVIGRSADADIRIEAKGVSRRQCEIWLGGFGATVEDLGSRNGTYLNQRKVTSAPLYHGDQLTLGSVTFEFYALAFRNPQETSAELVQCLAIEGGKQVSLESSRVFLLPKDETRRIEKLELAFEGFAEAAKFLAQATKEEDIIRGASERIRRAISLDRLAIFLLSEKPGTLFPVHVWRADSTVRGEILEVAEDIVRQSMASRSGVLADVEQEDGIRSAICVPLLTPKGVFGALYADRAVGESRLDETHLHLVTATMRLAALALSRCRHHDDAESRLQEMQKSLRASECARDDLVALLQAVKEPAALLDSHGEFLAGSGGALALIDELGKAIPYKSLAQDWIREPDQPVSCQIAGRNLELSFRWLSEESEVDPHIFCRILDRGSSTPDA